MVYYVELMAECRNYNNEFNTISLIVGFDDEEIFDEIKTNEFNDIHDDFNDALEKNYPGYYIDGLIEVENIIGEENDEDEDEEDENDEDDKIIADFMVNR